MRKCQSKSITVFATGSVTSEVSCSIHYFITWLHKAYFPSVTRYFMKYKRLSTYFVNGVLVSLAAETRV